MKKIKFKKRLILGLKLFLVIFLVNIILAVLNAFLSVSLFSGYSIFSMLNGQFNMASLGLGLLVYLLIILAVNVLVLSYAFTKWKAWIFRGLN